MNSTAMIQQLEWPNFNFIHSMGSYNLGHIAIYSKNLASIAEKRR